MVVLFAVLFCAAAAAAARRRGSRSIVTGFFQTTINFGVDDDGAGRRRRRPHVGAGVHDAVLDAAARVAGAARAREGLPVARRRAARSPGWRWSSSRGTGTATSRPKLWAVLSGFGWAAGTVATKYFQRGRRFDPLNFIAWQMLVGVLPLTLLPFAFRRFRRRNGARPTSLLLLYVGAVSTALGFLLWIAVCAAARGYRVAQHVRHSGDRAAVSMAVFGERLTRNEWIGIGASAPASRSFRSTRGARAAAARATCRRRRRSTAADAERRSGGADDGLPSPICDCR